MAPRGTRVSPEPQPQSSGPRKTLCPQQDPALPWAREKQTAPAWCNLVSTLLQGENGRKITFFLQNLEKINLDLTFVSNPLYVNVPQVEQMPWAAKLFQTRNPHGLNSAGGKKAPGCARRSLVQPQTTSHLWSGTPEDTELTAQPEKIEIKHHNSCPSHWSSHPFLAAFWKIQPFCVVLVKHFDGKKRENCQKEHKICLSHWAGVDTRWSDLGHWRICLGGQQSYENIALFWWFRKEKTLHDIRPKLQEWSEIMKKINFWLEGFVLFS